MGNTNELRAELEALNASKEAARKEFEAKQAAAEAKIKAINEKLREDDLALIRRLCRQHEVTFTELAKYIKHRQKTDESAADGEQQAAATTEIKRTKRAYNRKKKTA